MKNKILNSVIFTSNHSLFKFVRCVLSFFLGCRFKGIVKSNSLLIKCHISAYNQIIKIGAGGH